MKLKNNKKYIKRRLIVWILVGVFNLCTYSFIIENFFEKLFK